MNLLSVLLLIIFIGLYFTNSIDYLATINLWISFILCLLLTGIPLIVSVIRFLYLKNFYALIIGIIALLGVLFVLFMFLTPESGIPPIL
ncbi:UNVERIFIED_ORG: glucan phosphoethanolaminetransferase (alkaline phosphatase superfamily) [Heyndrickxia coagulans]